MIKFHIYTNIKEIKSYFVKFFYVLHELLTSIYESMYGITKTFPKLSYMKNYSLKSNKHSLELFFPNSIMTTMRREI